MAEALHDAAVDLAFAEERVQHRAAIIDGAVPRQRNLAGVDVDRSRNSEFGQFVLANMKTGDPNFQNFVDETGFDPRRDLQSALFGSFAVTGSSSRTVLLLRGNFDQERIKAAMLAKGVTSTSFQGVPIYSGKVHNGSAVFAFPEVGIAAVGDMATIQEVIGNRANPSVLDSHLQTAISAESATNDAWFVSLQPGSAFTQRLQSEAPQQMRSSQMLQSVLESSGGVQLGSNVQVRLNAITRSAQDATSLTDVIRFGASAVQTQRDKNPQAAALATALDTMTLTALGDAVHMSIQLPETSLERLAQNGIGPSSRH